MPDFTEFQIEPCLLRACAPAMSDDDARYYLKGVHIFEKNGSIFYEATNGHFLIRIRSDLPQETDCEGLNIIVPDFMVDSLSTSKFLNGFGVIGQEFVPAIIEGQTIRIEMPDGIASNKLVEGEFPDIEAVMPKQRHGVKAVPILGLNLDYLAKIAKSAKAFNSYNVEVAISDAIAPTYFTQTGPRGAWEAALMPVRF